MFRTGVLILTSPVRHLLSKVRLYLASAKQIISNRLYIKLEPDVKLLWSQNKITLPATEVTEQQLFIKLIPAIYAHAAATCSHLDVRVLQNFAKTVNPEKPLSVSPEVILVDECIKLKDANQYFNKQFNNECSNVRHLKFDNEHSSTDEILEFPVDNRPHQLYNKTVLGGTFDRLHNGHKIFLSAAVLHTKQQLAVGVIDGTMLHKKLLWELIEPLEKRIAALREFLTDIDSTLSYDIVPIYDPFGISVEVPEFDCIFVTDETIKGGHRVNEERKKRNMPELVIQAVPITDDPVRNSFEENKISSSSVRMRLLGTMLKEPEPRPHLNKKPYIIGVTGGIASGKSAIVRYLEHLGAAVVDCDRLAHKSYEPNSKIYQKIIDEFGKDILQSDGFINRKVLGAKVFGNKELRTKLNEIVWPEVVRMANEEIERHARNGASVIVKEAALLLEAGWQDSVHQVWACIIPEKEAIKRIKERDSLPEEQALQRINSQMSNSKRVENANVVFCSLWEPSYTKMQVNKAWENLQKLLAS